MQKYVFFIDIDETLIYHVDYLPEANVKAIKAAQKLGNKFFIDTGRGYSLVSGFIKDAIDFDGFVAGSGTYIEVEGKEIQRDFISPNILEKISDYILKSNNYCVLMGKKVAVEFNRRNDVDPIGQEITFPEEVNLKFPDFQAQKLFFPFKISPDEKEFYSKYLQVLDLTGGTDVWPMGNNKGKAIKKVMKLYPGFKSVACGDSQNDLSMLNVADVSVAMGNAPQSVKEVCTFVTGDAKDGGLADAIIYLTGAQI